MKYEHHETEEIWENDNWKLDIKSSGLVYSYSVVGVFAVEAVRVIFQRFEQFSKNHPSPYEIFINLAGLKLIDHDARLESIEGLKLRRNVLSALHILVSSSKIAMELATLELLTGIKMIIYTDRSLWNVNYENANTRQKK